MRPVYGLELEIGTVDGMQGREKEAVIITLVRSNEKVITSPSLRYLFHSDLFPSCSEGSRILEGQTETERYDFVFIDYKQLLILRISGHDPRQAASSESC